MFYPYLQCLNAGSCSIQVVSCRISCPQRRRRLRTMLYPIGETDRMSLNSIKSVPHHLVSVCSVSSASSRDYGHS